MNNDDTVISTGLFDAGTRITQQPELSLSAEVEPFAKGGWKTTVRASVRVYDGGAAKMYQQLEEMLTSGLNICHISIAQHEAAKEETS